MMKLSTLLKVEYHRDSCVKGRVQSRASSVSALRSPNCISPKNVHKEETLGD
jgi:hypothetical protein